MSEPKRCPPGKLGKLLEETLKSYGIAPDAPVTDAEKRLRAAAEGMEREGKTKSAIIARLSAGLVEAGREREELKAAIMRLPVPPPEAGDGPDERVTAVLERVDFLKKQRDEALERGEQ